jgi:hypothetical protein
MKTEYNPKKFLLEFFKDSKIEDKDGVLTISNVNPDLEKYIGKLSPYKFVFDINTHNRVKDSELIMQGSYFLLAIRDYLDSRGQASLLKIKSGIKKSDFIYEFSFLSTYQYLNDKKQLMSKILISNGKILEVDSSKFKTEEGNKNDIPILDPSKFYEMAKKTLIKKINKDTMLIRSLLKGKLKKELFRIKDHYSKQIKEKDEEVENCANKIKMLNSKLRHTSYERDRNIIMRIIRESTERLEMLRKRSYAERLRVEEEFHIKDEVEKHALSIKNSLINLTIYYF